MKVLFIQIFILVGITVTGFRCTYFSHPRLFKVLDKEQTGIDFENKLNYNDSLTVLDFEYMFNGAGVALLDVNKDGLLDVFFTGNEVSSRLYLNKGNMQFEDITQKAGLKTEGWCYGASVVDINQDGYPDIYICKAGNRNTRPEQMHNLFFINNGNNTFTESAAKMGLDDDGYDIQAAFLDYDHDGDLDMYLLRNSFVNYNRNNARVKQMDGGAASTDKLFRNNGDGKFTDVSKEAGITIEGFGLGIGVCDLNNDNWPDIYVSNDFLTNDLVWINNRNGTFTNKAEQMLHHTAYSAMGNDIADLNNDGKEDIVEVDMLPPDNKRRKLTLMGNTYEQFQQDLNFGYQPQYERNTLQLNNGDGTFSEIGQLAGVAATEWSWAPLAADFDNDGRKDLFIANGYRQDITNLDFVVYGKRALFMGTAQANRRDRIEMLKKFEGIRVPNYLFQNNGDLTFTNKALDWGLDDATYANGAAYGDLDNDGDLDLIVNNLDQPASIYQNQCSQIHPDDKWLRITLDGPQGNRDGIGAKVFAWQGRQMQTGYFSPYRGYLSTVEPFLHFAFQNKAVDSLQIIWPDGKQQIIRHPSLNKLLTISYRQAKFAESGPSALQSSVLFTPFNKETNIGYKHKEDDFVDFKIQPLLPHLVSHEGPGICVGDINGDGMEDFFIGAAAGGRGTVFTQHENGTFTKQALPDSNLSDNMGALLFDADNDGDQDLYIVSGGVGAVKNGNPSYQHLFYQNDGKGGFSQDKTALPVITSSGSSVIAADYDHDGDLDLFVAGRVSPGEYPLAPKSFLLRNDSKNGKCQFTDVTRQEGLNSGDLGMVTSALWTDLDNDGWMDLVMAGEFMPIRFFKNSKGTFSEYSTTGGLHGTHGWWNSIVAGDFDNDGDMDYIVGNLGLNGPYKASVEEPVCIYAKDYDKNGRLDPVMCHFEEGKEYITHVRDDINKQITPMRARFRDYTSYAGATFREAFREDEIKDAYIVRCETFASTYVENQGNGKFILHDLPLEAQFAPIYGMICQDFNGDGNLDVLCVGNSYATEVQTGRYDAQGSILLIGDGKGKFTVDRKQINVNGDNKAAAQLNDVNGRPLFLISSNSDSLHVFRMNRPSQRSVSIYPDETYAMITQRNGSRYKQEFYYGNTYLSQSSRRLLISSMIQSVVIYNAEGKKRQLNF